MNYIQIAVVLIAVPPSLYYVLRIRKEKLIKIKNKTIFSIKLITWIISLLIISSIIYDSINLYNYKQEEKDIYKKDYEKERFFTEKYVSILIKEETSKRNINFNISLLLIINIITTFYLSYVKTTMKFMSLHEQENEVTKGIIETITEQQGQIQQLQRENDFTKKSRGGK